MGTRVSNFEVLVSAHLNNHYVKTDAWIRQRIVIVIDF